MQLTQIKPTPEQMVQLHQYPKDEPIVMVNIIKLKAKIGKGEETGKEAYNRYIKNVQPFIAKAKAKLIRKGNVASTVIGDNKSQPDMIFIVEYPSVAHFFEMIKNPEYQKVGQSRTIALEYGGLIACKTENIK